MKAVRTVIAALCALILVACGGGSIEAPQFDPALTKLALSVPAGSETPTAGTPVQLSLLGAYTCQPNNPGGCPSTPTVKIDDATYTVDDATVATVDSTGLVTTLKQGTVTIFATKDSIKSNSVSLSVGAPVVQSIVVRVPNADATGTASSSQTQTVQSGAQATFKAYALYATGAAPQELPSTASVTWVSADPTIATATPGPNVLTTLQSKKPGQVDITATAVLADGSSKTAKGTLSVTNSTTVTSLSVTLVPATASIGKGGLQQFTAQGTYADGSTGPVSAGLLTWSSSLPAVATVDQNGLATGVNTTGKIGTTVITATLKTDTTKSSTATLSVGTSATDGACTVPFPIGSTVASAISALCDPLKLLLGVSVPLCTISNEGNVIDADPDNFATISPTLGLLFNSYASITVTAPAGTTFSASAAAPRKTGFIVGNPVGSIVKADIATELSVTTLLNGVIQQTTATTTSIALPSSPVPVPGFPSFPEILVPAATLPDPASALTVDLLGMRLNGVDTAAVSIGATKPFDAIVVTFNSGLLGLLTDRTIYAACSTTTPPATTP